MIYLILLMKSNWKVKLLLSRKIFRLNFFKKNSKKILILLISKIFLWNLLMEIYQYLIIYKYLKGLRENIACDYNCFIIYTGGSWCIYKLVEIKQKPYFYGKSISII